TDEEKAAAAKLPAAVAGSINQVLDKDPNAWLAARGEVLKAGPACLPLLAERMRRLDPRGGDREDKRLELIFRALARQRLEDIWARKHLNALQAVEEVAKRRDLNRPGKLAVLTAVRLEPWGVEADVPPDNYPAAVMQDFNFATGKPGEGH